MLVLCILGVWFSSPTSPDANPGLVTATSACLAYLTFWWILSLFIKVKDPNEDRLFGLELIVEMLATKTQERIDNARRIASANIEHGPLIAKDAFKDVLKALESE